MHVSDRRLDHGDEDYAVLLPAQSPCELHLVSILSHCTQCSHCFLSRSFKKSLTSLSERCWPSAIVRFDELALAARARHDNI